RVSSCPFDARRKTDHEDPPASRGLLRALPRSRRISNGICAVHLTEHVFDGRAVLRLIQFALHRVSESRELPGAENQAHAQPLLSSCPVVISFSSAENEPVFNVPALITFISDDLSPAFDCRFLSDVVTKDLHCEREREIVIESNFHYAALPSKASSSATSL